VKTLLLLRHAKSSWDDPGLDDHDRPLNKRGRRDAPRMGRLLLEEKLVPDEILCSTAARARETAEEVKEASGFAGDVRFSRTLYLAGSREILAAVRTVAPAAGTAMVIGHNPGIEELLDALTGAGKHLSTAALARIALPVERWRDIGSRTSGTLVHLWRP
jgi:phosphohistidine phosphatase